MDQACDLTQDFFAAILARQEFQPLDPDLGRSQAYLLSCCKHFLSNSRVHDAAIKRGGNRQHFSIDARDAEDRNLTEPIDILTPEACFDRHWPRSVLEFAAAEIRREYEQKGRLALIEQLQSSLFQEAESRTHVEIAESLAMNVSAVKKHAQRLRDCYLLRAQVSRTVDDPSLVNDELRELPSAIPSGGRPANRPQ